MDHHDLASNNSPNINSVLKPPKQRVPLKDLMAAAPEEDNTAVRKRRVSFANVNKIKEFSAGAESMVVCHTPAYEEPFSVSSDSSYPSGVDGWTPAKGHSSIYGNPPIHPEKENILIQSARMSTGMDFTIAGGHSVQNTRYSVNGMDLTEAVGSHDTFIDQRSRFSSGIDLTNIVGHSTQNTRYSNSGMDLTSIGNPNQSIVDHRTRFSIGMDFTNVIGHSTQNTRYSINGMDLTEAANLHQSFSNRGSTRFSMGMDMTNVAGNSMKTMRYSCNEMDITETGNPYIYQRQSCEGSLSINETIDDSDALELTEAVNCAKFTATTPKCRINNVDLTENVLYSVNNTRFSASNMDMTRAVSSSLSTARRKSSRYSLGSMELTEVINNSCDDLEFTEVIRDPRIAAGSTRNSVSQMDLTEGLVDIGVTRLSTENMDQTSVVDDKLEYSADAEGSMNLTKTTFNLDPPTYDKENILPNKSLKNSDTQMLFPKEDPVYINSNLSSINLCTTAYGPLPEITSKNLMDESEACHSQNIASVSNSHVINHQTCKQIVNMSPCSVIGSGKSEIISDKFKEELSTFIVNKSTTTNNDAKVNNEHEVFHLTENSNNQISFPPKLSIQNDSFIVGRVQINDAKQKEACSMDIVTLDDQDLSNRLPINDSKNVGCPNENQSNVSNCRTTDVNHEDDINESLNLDSGISVKETDLSETCQTVTSSGHNSSGGEDITTNQHNINPVFNNDLLLQDESKNIGPICKLLNEDAMDVSVTDNIANEEHKSNISKEKYSSEIEKSELPMECPKVMSHLNESVMNMSIENCSLIRENENILDEQQKLSNFNLEYGVSVSESDDYEINQQANIVSNNQVVNKDVAPETLQSFELNVSVDSSMNLSSKGVLYNQNITMTRRRDKNSYICPETSIELSKTESSVLKNEETSSMKSTASPLKPLGHVYEDRLSQPENSNKNEINPLQSEVSHEKGGKRSFDAALEPENDTEESPIKQLCLSREEPSEEYDVLSNVTAPSFLMNTLNAPNETVPSLDEHEKPAVHDHVCHDQLISEPNSSIERDMNINDNSYSKKMSETKQEFSLRIDDSLPHNMSENPLHHEVIDLCESSFDATSTEVRELINNSLYKTRHVPDADISATENGHLNCLTKNISISDIKNKSFGQGDVGQESQTSLIKGICNVNSLNMDDSNQSKVLEREVANTSLTKVDKLSKNIMANRVNTGSKRKKEKVKSLGNNTYVADLIPNFVEIVFSIDPYDNVNNVNYHNICVGESIDIGEYLLKQGRNHVLPDKGSDLILQLQSTNKSFLARLARDINLICKYHNGSIKGNILTLEVASCKNRFWALIDVNIKHPKYLTQTDITISKQKIGEIKLSHVRKVFSSFNKSQDQLLKFAEAMTQLQYSN